MNANIDLDPQTIEDQLHIILFSPEFKATPRQKKFLQFVTERFLAGRANEIKGYTIATEVFGRKDDFDPKLDPIVSVEARRLRRALEHYYLVAGMRDPLRIDIPKGAYVPTFTEQSANTVNANPQDPSSAGTGFEGLWPTLLILPFQNLNGDSELDYLAVGFTTELAYELTRYQEIRVLMARPERLLNDAAQNVARFSLNGSLRKDETSVKVTVNLEDTLNNIQIWSDAFQSDFAAARVIAFQEKIAQEIAVKTVGERGVISKALSAESRNIPPKRLKTYQAILRFYDHRQAPTPASFQRALEALEYAVTIEPECGQVWSMLGLLYGMNYALDFTGFEGALDKAAAYCQKGAQINLDNQHARFFLAVIRLFNDDVAAAKDEVERALALNPNSLFILDWVGYILTLIGEWDRGPAMIRKVMRLNPYYHPTAHYALWVDWVRQEDYERAYRETFNFIQSWTFWNPMMRAVPLGQLGRIAEGKQAVEQLLTLKPNFPGRGRMLIKRYIKFDDIVEKMIAGLAKVGLDVA
jgi:adenylate cyclase